MLHHVGLSCIKSMYLSCYALLTLHHVAPTLPTCPPLCSLVSKSRANCHVGAAATGPALGSGQELQHQAARAERGRTASGYLVEVVLLCVICNEQKYALMEELLFKTYNLWCFYLNALNRDNNFGEDIFSEFVH